MPDSSSKPEWLTAAPRAMHFSAEAELVIWDSLRIGTGRKTSGPSAGKSALMVSTRLVLQRSAHGAGRLSVSGANERFEDLVAYFKSVVDAAAHHGVPLSGTAPTWVKPRIVADERAVLSSSSVRDCAGTRAIFESLASGRRGALITDATEDGETEIHRDGDDIYFGERDWDGENEVVLFRVEHRLVEAAAHNAADSLDRLRSRLAAELGVDPFG